MTTDNSIQTSKSDEPNLESTPMQNSQRLRVNWRQAAGEAVLLLLGVLLALAGQAWWEQRVERKATAEHIDNLLLEVNENSAGLERLIEKHEAYIIAGTDILNQMQDAKEVTAKDLFRKKIQTLSFFSDYRPVTSALDNFVSSDGFKSIENAEVRLAILKYVRGIDYHNIVHAEQADFFLLSFAPYLSQHIPLLNVQYLRDIKNVPAQSRFEMDPKVLTESPEFENLIVRRIAAEQDAMIFAQSLAKLTNELQGLLQNLK